MRGCGLGAEEAAEAQVPELDHTRGRDEHVGWFDVCKQTKALGKGEVSVAVFKDYKPRFMGEFKVYRRNQSV